MCVKNVVTQNLMTAPQTYLFKLMVSAREIKWFSPILPIYFFACLRNFSSKIFIKINPQSHNDIHCSFKLKLIWIIKASFENTVSIETSNHMTKLLTHINTPQKVTSLKYNNDPKRLSRHYYDFLNLLQKLTSMTSLKVAWNHFMAHADWVLIVHESMAHESLIKQCK